MTDERQIETSGLVAVFAMDWVLPSGYIIIRLQSLN